MINANPASPGEESPAQRSPKPRTPLRRLVVACEVVVGVGLALAIGAGVRSGFAQATHIDSSSMAPTLHAGDFAMMDKRARTIRKLRRGDIIVYRWDPSEESSTFVKRIVGLPGETLQFMMGRVFINGQLLEEPYLPERPQWEVSMPIQLGEDEFFVMGDNRNNSEDSRDRGPVSRAHVMGKVTSIIWPLTRAGYVE